MAQPGRRAAGVAFCAWVALLGGCSEIELVPGAGGDPSDPGGGQPVDSGLLEEPTLAHAGSDGALDGWRDPVPQGPDEADFLFEPGTIHRIDIELDGSSRSALQSDPRTDVPATLRFGDESWNVGVRLKGSYSFRPLSGKSSFKVDFEEFEVGRRFYGLQRITLNNMVQDRSMIREHEAYWMYARLGVPAPRHGYAEVYVDGEHYGLYGLLETLDGNWAERVFPNDGEGSIYEGGYGVDVEDGDADKFDLQRQGDLAEPFTDMALLIEEMEATTPEDYLPWLERRFDTRSLFRMWAMDLVLGHRDGYVKRKNNFLLYHGLQTDRWWMIPWGQDQTFKDGMGVYGNYSGELAKRCAESPACMERLDDAITYVIGVWEAWDLHGHAAATGASIEAACAADPRKEGTCGYENELEMILARPDEVRAEQRGE